MFETRHIVKTFFATGKNSFQNFTRLITTRMKLSFYSFTNLQLVGRKKMTWN